MRIGVIPVQRDSSVFYRTSFGYVRHGRPSFHIWVNRRLIQYENECFFFTLGKGKRIKTTEKGNYVVVPDEEYSIFIIGWKSGYRGTSDYEIISGNVELELPFEDWASPRGNLGVSTYALLSVHGDRVIAKLTRTGRLYGDAPEKVVEYVAKEDMVEERELPPACFEDTELAQELM